MRSPVGEPRRAEPPIGRALRIIVDSAEYQRSIVESPNVVGAPVTGCRHFIAVRRSSSRCKSPRAGGAASRCPTTEKRRFAHRSCVVGS